MVGTSAAFSLRKLKGDRAARLRGTKYVAVRALKLYALGVLLQGGGWFGNYSYGFNLSTLRWCGILNRIGFGYLVVGLVEIWVPEVGSGSPGKSPHCAIFTVHAWKWLIVSLFVVLQIALTFGTYVPDWQSEWGWNATVGDSVLLNETFTIKCNVRGHVKTPECSATGFFDRALFGQQHLGVWMSKRLPACSSCSPGSPGRFSPDDCHYIVNNPATRWGQAHIYDPEGALATVPAPMSAFLGTHFGRVVKSADLARSPRAVLAHWSSAAAALMGLGVVLHACWWPMNKQLWSTPYLLFMAGSCGAALTLVYAAVDAPVRLAAMSATSTLENGQGEQATADDAGTHVRLGSTLATTTTTTMANTTTNSTAAVASSGEVPRWSHLARRFLYPMQCMGMNAILVFFYHGTAQSLLDIVYVQTPAVGGGWVQDKPINLFGRKHSWFNEQVLGAIFEPHVGQLVYVLLKISCFCAAMVYCKRVGYFWKV